MPNGNLCLQWRSIFFPRVELWGHCVLHRFGILPSGLDETTKNTRRSRWDRNRFIGRPFARYLSRLRCFIGRRHCVERFVPDRPKGYFASNDGEWFASGTIRRWSHAFIEGFPIHCTRFPLLHPLHLHITDDRSRSQDVHGEVCPIDWDPKKNARTMIADPHKVLISLIQGAFLRQKTKMSLIVVPRILRRIHKTSTRISRRKNADFCWRGVSKSRRDCNNE